MYSQRGERVKAHVGKYFVPSVKCSSVVMDGMSAVALSLQIVCDGFNRPLCQYGFIRVFSGAEKPDAHTRQYFEFGIGGTCADSRDRKKSRRIMLLQVPGSSESDLRKTAGLSSTWDQRRIPAEGRARLVFFFRCRVLTRRTVKIFLFIFCEYIEDLVIGVAFWLGDPGIQPCIGKSSTENRNPDTHS